MPDFTRDGEDFKSIPSTPHEKYLTEKHGSLHSLIPDAVNADSATLASVAGELEVSSSWLSGWLKRNGYQRVIHWKKVVS